MNAIIDQNIQMTHDLLAEAEELRQRNLRIRSDRNRMATPPPTTVDGRKEEIRARLDHSRAQDHQVATHAQERAFCSWRSPVTPGRIAEWAGNRKAKHLLAAHAPSKD
ncbi:hypothetical protein [Kocuria atrinae]|uniref:hypothetical protein n=1 Tax=Kocuria atrinae TaxID=592377 RepID=UPI00036B23D0|nr:hypothetical protein [Kocuria atrinae]